MAAAAANVVRHCSEGDIAEIIGSYSVTTAGRLLFKPGSLPVEDVIQLARHLILHGVMGDQPPEEFERKKGEYSDKFDVRSFVYTAVAHLGMSEADAWNMTMTSFRAAMNAKFPQKDKGSANPGEIRRGYGLGRADAGDGCAEAWAALNGPLRWAFSQESQQ
jgi:hypothetical protein